MSDIFYGVSSLISLLLTAWLWYLAARRPTERTFWALLASAWSINVFSSILWGVYMLLVSDEIVPGITDLFYVLRYILFGLAIWLHPKRFQLRQLAEILAVMLAAGFILWFGLSQPLLAAASQNRDYILGGVIYPVLDAGAIWLVGQRWNSEQSAWKSVFGFLLLSSLAYGLANLVNYWARSLDTTADHLVALIAWLLTDILAILAAWRATKMGYPAPSD